MFSSQKIQDIFFRPLQKSTWKNCLKAAEKKFKYAIGHLYVSEVQSRVNNDNDVLQVQEGLKNEFNKITFDIIQNKNSNFYFL